MILLSIDPGLDLVAVARWNWARAGESPDRAIEQVLSFSTEPETPTEQRLLAIASYCESLASRAGLVVIERPAHGGRYDRNAHKEGAIARAMYWSSLASGAIGVGVARTGCPTVYLEVGRVKKDVKQAIARGLLDRTELKPIGARRRGWNPDELDAVAIGMQAMTDVTVSRLAFPPNRSVA